MTVKIKGENFHITDENVPDLDLIKMGGSLNSVDKKFKNL